MKSDKDSKALLLPLELYKQMEKQAKVAGFRTVDEYAISLLEKAAKEESTENDSISKDEDEEVKKRLRSLGYLG